MSMPMAKSLANPPECFAYDPSVEGVTAVPASVDELLNPDRRIAKTTLIDQPIRRAIGPKLWDGESEN